MKSIRRLTTHELLRSAAETTLSADAYGFALANQIETHLGGGYAANNGPIRPQDVVTERDKRHSDAAGRLSTH